MWLLGTSKESIKFLGPADRTISFFDCLDPFFSIFRAPLVIWEVYNVPNTNRKVGLAERMRSQPTFYKNWFVRYRIIGHFEPFWEILGHLQSFERYKIYETQIEKWVLQTKWGVCRPNGMNISGDIENCRISPYILTVLILGYLHVQEI